jgi:ribose transport system substrate-binding protein
MLNARVCAVAGVAGLLWSALSFAADTYLPQCFKPFTAQTKVMQFTAKKPPYRIAMANGFVGNTWRIQMIKTLKAYAETPEMKPYIKELKIVSTGTDVANQIGAIDNFINAGFDAILTIAVNPTAFKPVIKRAKAAGVVLIPFDNVLDTDEVIQVNEDQKEMGRIMGRWLEKQGATKGKVLEVRGLPGNSVDRDRHLGFREIMDKYKGLQIIEVVGNWDDGTAQKVVADAIAVHGRFSGMFVQGGSTGAVRALIDAKHPYIPVAGEAENGFRKLIAEHAREGLKGSSAGQSPALVAISLKAAVAALQGKKLPQYISVPIPYADYTTLKAGVNYYPDQSDNFFTPNDFPPCGVTFTAMQIMGHTEANQ